MNNFDNISLQQLQVFKAIVDTKSILQASKELHLVQSGVSQSLIKLERTLGHQLFIRLPRGMTLTGEGERFKEIVYPALQSLKVGLEHLSSDKVTSFDGLLRLGSIREFMESILGDLLLTFQEKNRLAKLECEMADSTLLLSKVSKGELDFAFIVLKEIPAKSFGNVNCIKIFKDQMVWATSIKSHKANQIISYDKSEDASFVISSYAVILKALSRLPESKALVPTHLIPFQEMLKDKKLKIIGKSKETDLYLIYNKETLTSMRYKFVLDFFRRELTI